MAYVTSALSPSIPISFSLSPFLAIILIFGFISGNFLWVIVEFQVSSLNSSSSQLLNKLIVSIISRHSLSCASKTKRKTLAVVSLGIEPSSGRSKMPLQFTGKSGIMSKKKP